MQEARYFAGGNTESGFFTCFPNILPEAEQRRMFYIKGGPGVGKSSLMKRMAAGFEGAGQQVEYYHCSSDPDSLDGISVPALGVAMMDGTSPHVYDPVIPGARDTLISLGDFLDEGALRPHMADIRKLMEEISQRFARCYQYLRGAARVRSAANRGGEEPGSITKLVNDLTDAYLPLRGGRGKSRSLFAEAFTPKGFVSHLATLPHDTAIAVETPFGQTADGLLRALQERAQSRGLNAVALRDPLEPGLLSHLSIPAHSILFTTSPFKGAKETVPADGLMRLRETTEQEKRFDQNAYELLIQRAIEQLKAAKGLHDELETFYVRNMDFLRWEKLLDVLREEFGL